jgi:hypothetical protein
VSTCETPTIVGGYNLIDIRRLSRHRQATNRTHFSWGWRDNDTGEILASIAVHVERFDCVVLRYRTREPGKQWEEVNQPVSLAFTRCHYGGKRPWFLCPGRACGKRVAILYLAGKYFRCRHCHGLSYYSQRYGRGDRALLRARNIRSRLGGDRDVSKPFPAKPKRMRRSTYLRLLEETERSLKEYRDENDQQLSRLLGRASWVVGGRT